MSASIPLAQIDAEIWDLAQTYPELPPGVRGLWFMCPLPECGHGCLMPFHDGPLVKIPRADGEGQHVIWHRDGGSTIADLTLSPSYLLSGQYTDGAGVVRKVPTCGLHGYVRDGQWVPC